LQHANSRQKVIDLMDITI